jgi:transposase-like protein
MTKKKQIQTYTEAFRREAVRLADEPGRTASDVAREIGLHANQIYNWRRQLKNSPKCISRSRMARTI